MQKYLKTKIAKYCTNNRLETRLSFEKDAENLERCLILAKLEIIFDKSIITDYEKNQESAEIERCSMTAKV